MGTRWNRVSTIYVVSKNKQIITIFYLKIFIFTDVKNCSLLHRRVIVMGLCLSRFKIPKVPVSNDPPCPAQIQTGVTRCLLMMLIARRYKDLSIIGYRMPISSIYPPVSGYLGV